MVNDNANHTPTSRAKTIERIFLPFAISILCCACDMSVRERPEPPPGGDKVQETKAEAAIRQVPEPVPAGPVVTVVYYFHGTMRCRTCLDIEEYARKTVLNSFYSDLADGKMEWRSINYEVPENRHYSTDFDLQYPSLALAREQGGYRVAHKLLPNTWDLVNDPDDLREYVKREVAEFVEEARPATDEKATPEGA